MNVVLFRSSARSPITSTEHPIHRDNNRSTAPQPCRYSIPNHSHPLPYRLRHLSSSS
jgi:hypothetical protein